MNAIRGVPAPAPPGSTEPAAARTARRRTGLRRNSVAISVMLIVQFGLGLAANLYTPLPAGGTPLADLPVLAGVHAIFGVFLLIAGITVLVRAIRVRSSGLLLTSAAGLLAIAGAAVAGALFTGSGRPGPSLAMALLTCLAQLCYLRNVASAGGRTAG